MNSFLYTVTLCTILLAIMCNFDEINAVPSPNNSTKPVATAPKAPVPLPKLATPPTTKPAPPYKLVPPLTQPAKPVAATPKAPVPLPKLAKPPTPKLATPPTPTVTKRPHDERGVVAASIAPILIGLLGQGIGYIMHYIAI
uniref:SJCHGC03840 protein n=1 Tax=Schistosoma japonicum TaxID=6182 RepID=Q5D9W3_SCHJA|nr:SJCHGC03840 protein [Schistosoma japonicum]